MEGLPHALGASRALRRAPAASLSVKAPARRGRQRLQWGDASGICRAAHCAGRRGREAEGGGLLNRYRVVKLYRGFESLRLRQSVIKRSYYLLFFLLCPRAQ